MMAVLSYGFAGYVPIKTVKYDMINTVGFNLFLLAVQDVEASTEAKEKLLGTSKGAADDDGLHLEYPTYISMILLFLSICRRKNSISACIGCPNDHIFILAC